MNIYDKNFRLNSDGGKLFGELSAAIAPVMKKWMDAGVNPREVAYWASQVANDESLSYLLTPPELRKELNQTD